MDLDEGEYKATRKLNGLDKDIQVGEYVRTISGNIDKVDALYGMIENTVHLENHKWQSIKNIVKHSPNLIELVECGDYVNGHKVVNEIYGEDDNNLYFEIEGGFNKAQYIGEKDIKNVVTREQFNSVMYKVKE